MTTSSLGPNYAPARRAMSARTFRRTSLVLLMLGGAVPPVVAESESVDSREIVAFALPAAAPRAVSGACRPMVKLDALIRTFEAHPELTADVPSRVQRFDSLEAIRAHLTAHHVASNDLTILDCNPAKPTTGTACIVLPTNTFVSEIRYSGNDGDLDQSFQIIGFSASNLTGDAPRMGGGRFKTIDIGWQSAQTPHSDRVYCVTAKNWSAKPSLQRAQLRYRGQPRRAPIPR